MSVIQRGVKNSFRNLIRTFSIVFILGLSMGLALTMLISYKTVEQKIKTVKSSVGNTVSISPAGMRRFEGGGEPLNSEDEKSLAKLPHVTKTVSTLGERLSASNSNLVSAVDAGSLGQRLNQGTSPQTTTRKEGSTQTSITPPVTLNGTTDPATMAGNLSGGTIILKEGQNFNGSSLEYIATVGTKLATKNNLSVGSTFIVNNNNVKVVGIFDAGNDFTNNQVLMPLGAVQTITGQANSITGIYLTVDSVENISLVTTEVKNIMGTKADVTNSADQSAVIIEPLENILSISMISLIGSLVAGAIIILLTMMMIVRERRREIGVLKALGASNLKVVSQFVVEALTLTTLASVIGLVVGYFASTPITKLLLQNSASTAITSQVGRPGTGRIREFAGSAVTNVQNLQASIGWEVLLYGFAAAILIAIIGSAVPAWLISKVRPAEVMRAE